MAAQPIDILLIQDEEEIWDITIDGDGDLEKDFGFGTTIGLTIFGRRRATAGEVPTPQNREGWIGNILPTVAGHERGSKGWLFQQARLTQDSVIGIKNAHQDSLAWMQEDGLAKSIIVNSSQNGISGITEEINIDGEPFFFDVWNNTRILNV